MRIEVYLRVVGDEATIRSIHAETNLPNASVKHLKAERPGSGGEMWWNWQTVRTPIDTDNPDDGIRALLRDHRPIFPTVKRHRGPEVDIYLELVSYYEEGEEARGLYLSAETVELLSEIGAALDNDVVMTAAGNPQADGMK